MSDWLKIAGESGIKTTLFVTGLFANNNKAEMARLYQKSRGQVEFAGHTYSAFVPNWLFIIFKLISGRRYGPKIYQRVDIAATKKAVESITGEPMLSWRTHEYNSDSQTYSVLGELGIKVVSEKYQTNFQPTAQGGIVFQPVNTLPDHENINHHFMKYCGGLDKLSIHDWLLSIKKIIDEKRETSDNVVILAHPSCMKSIDNFETFKDLCQYLESSETCLIKDLWKS
jgi:hypothetical protein